MTGSVVITGVSSGIGRDAAHHLAGRGLRVFGTVRRPDDATKLAADLGEGFVPIVLDVTDEDSVRAGAATVAAELGGRRLRGLVNNAGIAVAGPLAHVPIADIRQQLEVNVIGLLAVTQAFLPLLGTDPEGHGEPGRIVNISSISGTVTYPFLAPYAASKHAVESISDGLRRELTIHGIDVVVIQPGTIRTAIWDKADETDLAPYGATPYAEALAEVKTEAVSAGRRGPGTEAVCEAIHTALTIERPRTRYPLHDGGRLTRLLLRHAPDRRLDRLITSRLGLNPPEGR